MLGKSAVTEEDSLQPCDSFVLHALNIVDSLLHRYWGFVSLQRGLCIVSMEVQRMTLGADAVFSCLFH